MQVSRQQLRMRFTRFDELAPPRPAPGYGLRRFRPGDEDAWIALLATGEFGAWDRPRLERMLDGERAPMPRGGTFFATREDRPVGAACAFLHREREAVVPEIGWVVVHPEHRGHGLGSQVCRAVLGFIRGLGHGYAFLLTEDFRLPAIETYLRLGFEAEMVGADHPERWAALRVALAGAGGGDLPDHR